MRYVLDASVALKWVLNEVHADKARQLREAYEQGRHELLAPDDFPLKSHTGFPKECVRTS